MKRLGIILVLVLAGCGGGGGDGNGDQAATTAATTATTATPAPPTTTDTTPDQDAGEFMKELTERSLRGQYGRVWETLHPSHQAVVSRDRFDGCERGDGGGEGTTINVDVVETYEEPVAVPGTDERPNSTAVTLRFAYDNPLTGKRVEEHQTLHAILVNGDWKWILAPKTFQAYVKGECPEE
jgi:hypothetical protein